MDKTPKGKSLRFVRSSDNKPTSTSSPVTGAKKQRFWDHDAFSPESNDVLWDWDSPKNIRPKALKNTQRDIHKSPKLAPKKTSQIDHIKNYEKLKQELQALRDEIARTDDCLPLSPVDEQILREENINTDINSFIEDQYFHIENQEREAGLKPGAKQTTKECGNETIDEMLNDDCDEQLFLCSQMIEEKLNKLSTVPNTIVCRNDVNKNVDISNFNSKQAKDQQKITQHKYIPNMSPHEKKSIPFRSIDDSFDAVLREFEDEDIDVLTQVTNKNTSILPKQFQNKNGGSLSFKRTISDANVQYSSTKIDLNVDKSGFHRTQSFESAPAMKNNDDLPKDVMEKIERKRKEALAKLLEKKEKEKRIPSTPNSSSNDKNSFLKCSPDEIEKKRLQAKAIREAKQREIIERNRQEAMRRLEFNRRKRMENSKSQEKKL